MLALGDLGMRLQALKTMLSSGERGAPDGLGDAVVECCEALAEANRVSEALDLLATLGGLKSTFSVDVVRRLDATLALVLDQAWRSEEALAVVRPLIASCQSDPAVPRTFICALRICEGSSLWKMNRVDEAIALLRDLRSELLQLPDSRHLALVAQQLCSAYMLKGDSSTAIAFAWDAIVSARRVGAKFVEGCALGNLGMLEKQRCRWAASIEAHSDARRIFEQGRNAYRATKEKRSLAIVHWKMGHLSDASRLAAECISESKELRDETMHWYGTLLAGLALLHSGAYAEAAAILTSDANWETPRSNSRPSLLTSEFLGDVELEQGNAEAALKHYDEVFPKAVALVPKGDIVAELLRRRAECFLLLGRADEAYGEAMTGLSHCRELL